MCCVAAVLKTHPIVQWRCQAVKGSARQQQLGHRSPILNGGSLDSLWPVARSLWPVVYGIEPYSMTAAWTACVESLPTDVAPKNTSLEPETKSTTVTSNSRSALLRQTKV